MNQVITLILQITSLVIVNLVGLVLCGLMFMAAKNRPKNPNEKLILSTKISLTSTGILLIALVDLGIYSWIKSGDFRASFSSMMVILLFALCVLPIMFLVIFFGSYLQFGYREMYQGYIDSMGRKMPSRDAQNAHNEDP